MASAIAGVTLALVKVVGSMVKKDIAVMLPRAALRMVRLSGRLLKQDDRAEVLAWFQGEYDSVRSEGGTGVGVALGFVIIIAHRAVVTRLVTAPEE